MKEVRIVLEVEVEAVDLNTNHLIQHLSSGGYERSRVVTIKAGKLPGAAPGSSDAVPPKRSVPQPEDAPVEDVPPVDPDDLPFE